MAGRHVRTGDRVMITQGDHKGRVGEVMRIDTKHDRVYVRGINMITKFIKPTRVNPQGGSVTKEAPVHISNVSPVVSVDGQDRPTRVRFEKRADGSRVSIAARNGQVLNVLRKKPA